MQQQTQTKMTIKVSRKLWDSFDGQIRALPIKRDQYLASIIETETPRLEIAMRGKRLSVRANRYISGLLAKRAPTTVNIGISKRVADELNAVVQRSHLVRDAFINRLIMFITPPKALLKFLEIPAREDLSLVKEYGQDALKPTHVLEALEEAIQDPLWYLHTAIERLHSTSLYLVNFPDPKMDAFACWVDDAAVPGTRANIRETRENARLIDALDDFHFTPLD